MNRRLFVRSAAAGLAAASAGCGALRSGSTRTTVTPAPVRTDGPTPQPVGPGFTTARVTDPDVLGRAHRSTLSKTGGFRVLRTGLARYVDGFEQSRARLTAGRNGTEYRVAFRGTSDRLPLIDRTVNAVTLWFDATGTFRQVVGDGTTAAERLPPEPARAASEFVEGALPTGVGSLLRAFNGIDVTRSGEDYRLQAEASGPVRGLPRYPGDVRPVDARLSAGVETDGLVRWYTLRYAATLSDRTAVTRNALVRFDPDQPARLDRPEWVAEIAADGGPRTTEGTGGGR